MNTPPISSALDLLLDFGRKSNPKAVVVTGTAKLLLVQVQALFVSTLSLTAVPLKQCMDAFV